MITEDCAHCKHFQNSCFKARDTFLCITCICANCIYKPCEYKIRNNLFEPIEEAEDDE